MRQGLNTDLIIKGQRRLKGLFEGDMILKAVARSLELIDFGPSLMQGFLSPIVLLLIDIIDVQKRSFGIWRQSLILITVVVIVLSNVFSRQ